MMLDAISWRRPRSAIVVERGDGSEVDWRDLLVGSRQHAPFDRRATSAATTVLEADLMFVGALSVWP